MRLGVYLGIPSWCGSGRAIPDEWNWQEFDMYNGGEGQWVGYSIGGDTLPNPAFGSVSNEPTEVTDLIALYDDTASGIVLAVFRGVYPSALAGIEVSIGGYVLYSYEVEVISGNTWVRFNDMPGVWNVGDTYEVLFGRNLPHAPIIEVAPLISGTIRNTQPVTGSDGTWRANPTHTISSRKWYRSTTASGPWAEISGASVPTYTLTNSDADRYIRYGVTATNPIGSSEAFSAAALVAQILPVNTFSPTLSGVAQVGTNISGTFGNWTGAPSVTRQWQIAAASGGPWTDISGQTGAVVAVVSGMVGQFIRVRVRAVNSAGEAFANSQALGPVFQ